MKKTGLKRQVLGSEPDFPFQLLVAARAVAEPRTPVFENTDYHCCTVEFVHEGSGYLEINGHSYTINENSVYFLQKHSDNKYWQDKGDPWKKLFFMINGEFMEYLFRIYRLEKVYHIPDCPQLKKYFEEMLQVKQGIGGTGSRAAIIFHRFLEECHGLLHKSLERCLPAELLELKNFLDNNVYEKVSLEFFCRKMHRSSPCMIRLFREYFGSTPYDYLMRKRIEDAQVMLRYSNFSVKEIAGRLRFSDQYYFSNYFKRKVGVSPQKYKKDSSSVVERTS
ncbi:MAG: hypothetical protein A2X49_14875 [Lentisphaerae bacterium GWF2_52_8]|nr:MAG: hypothetical protein A2X49_14875 [Lentisphaerae bacterium GWF2_52_8]